MCSPVALLLVVLSVLAVVQAFNVGAGRRMTSSRGMLTMKGKGNRVPVNQRGEYLKQQRMMEARSQMEANKVEGVPVFKVFVRPKAGGLWIPCGDLAGDQRATALVNAYMSGVMTEMYEGQITQGIAKSIFSQEDQFVQGLIENYKPFKKFTKNDLEFGYKVAYEGLEEKMGEQKIKALKKGDESNWVDEIRNSIGGILGGK